MPSVSPFSVAAGLWSIVRPGASQSRLLQDIYDRAANLRQQSDAALKNSGDELRAAADARCDDTLASTFALVMEAVRRVHGVQLFETQLLAGIAMARGAIAEMATGEGKTLAAALPAMLFSLRGPGVHVATPNAYLAQRDFECVCPILQLLGTRVGLVLDSPDADAKRAACACEVTYATGYELGFDYLRDQLQSLSIPRLGLGQRQLQLLRGESIHRPAVVQPQRKCAIIDEIDSVLIDEACLPLVLSDCGSESGSPEAYAEAQRIAARLREGDDFVCDRQAQCVKLTQAGQQSVHEHSTCQLRLPLDRPWSVYIEQALASQYLFARDVDYVVTDGSVMLVDEFSGRIFAERKWRDGLHQAVEAKEGLLNSAELRSAVRISRQRFFRLYETICGMTGTAADSRREFQRHFDLPVVQIPLHKPSRRETLTPRFFVDAAAKLRAIVMEAMAMHRAGRPVLIGSRTIRNSELLAARLAEEGMQGELLNGKQDRAEAEIIAKAGLRGAITIATNMAGRGTDITLEPGVAELGGLHVIGVECHESARIDRQLLGRAGRQGDPGSGRFFVSADDPLLLRFAPRLAVRMRTLPNKEGEIGVDLFREVRAAQQAAENAAFAARQRMLEHDRWMDKMAEMIG